jgi:hypothetical protein
MRDSDVRRLGGDLAKELPTNWNRIDPRTGAPIGIGRGWDYAPGNTVSHLIGAMAEKVRHWQHALAKAFMDRLPTRSADELSEAFRALPGTADDTRRYAQRVLDPPAIDTDPGAAGPPPVRTLGLLRSDQVRHIRQVADTDVERFDLTLDPFAIRHVDKEHGNARAEARRGQRAVTIADYALLPQLVSESDTIEEAGKSWKTGAQLVRFVWDRGGEEWVATFEIRKGRKSLALETLFIRLRKRG